MATEQHVGEVNSNENDEKPTRKIKKTVLDSFSNLVKPQEKIRIKSGVNLVRHLVENNNEENANELKYALGRIVRGLGSSTVSARTGFYTALVALINTRDDISVDDIFNHIEKELHKAGSNTKGENADIYLGQILTCGAIMRSELWSKSSEEDQKKIIELLLKNSKERIYLSLVAYKFITDKFTEMNERDFKKVFHMIKEVLSKPWAEQNIDSLYLLLCVKNKNLNYVNGKFLQKTIGTKDVICPESLEELSSLLTTIPRVTFLNHPIYEIVSKDLATSVHLINFVRVLDSTLQRPNRNKQLIVTKIYTVILQNLQDYDSIPHVLTKNFIQQTLNYFKTFKGKNKDGEFQQSTNKFFETLLATLKTEGVKSETKIAVLKKLLFYPGTFIFEKITRSKVVQQITFNLDKEGVKMLAALYEGVVRGTEKIDSEYAQNENWLNNDRLYAAHLLIKLLSHAAMKDENGWKMEKLGFLMHLGLFKVENGTNIGSELAASLKTAFFGSLDMKLLKLEDLQAILSHLVRELDSKLTPDNLETILRTPISPEEYETWLKTTKTIRKIEKKKKKAGLRSVFLTLFLHMGLQLFNDAKLATDSLKELFVCYEKTRKSRKSSESMDENEETNETSKTNDPAWVEVVTDLFLNLLSRNYHLLRSLIRCVFPHLCQHVTASSIHQILSVIDPKNEDNPLSKPDQDSDQSSEEENSDSDAEEEEDEDLEEEEEDEELEEESVNDRLRMALHKVLNDNGYQTDEESVDLDQLSDTEGEKLDAALAEAFKEFRPNHGKRRKQSKDQETLTHFRVRALDLIDIYLDSTPSMILTLEIMLPLLQAVEFSIRDQHQKPLHDRLKSCLKKLSSLKKFSDTDGADEAVLGNLLRSLLEKGTKNSLIVQDMGVQIADCCIFVVRCADSLTALEATPKKARKQLKSSIAGIVRNELHDYFHKRDCLTPYVLFKNAIQLAWDGSATLAGPLLGYVFSDDVKPFKKNQALELLRLFYANHRYLSTRPEKINQKLSEEHARFFQNVDDFFGGLCGNPRKVKEKYVSSLFNVLAAMKTSRLNIDTNWGGIAEKVREYRSFVTFSKDAKSAFNKLCNHLNVSHLVKMKPKTVNIGNSMDEDDKTENTEKDKPDKKKRKKTKDKDKLRLKKEAKELRLNSLSEGFKTLDFTAAEAIGADENEDDERPDEKNSAVDLNGTSKKRKKSVERQEQENGTETKTAKKKKNKRDKSDSSVNSSATNGASSKTDSVNKRKSNEDAKIKKKKKVVH